MADQECTNISLTEIQVRKGIISNVGENDPDGTEKTRKSWTEKPTQEIDMDLISDCLEVDSAWHLLSYYVWIVIWLFLI